MIRCDRCDGMIAERHRLFERFLGALGIWLIAVFLFCGLDAFFFPKAYRRVPVYSWGLGLDLCSRRVGRVVVVSWSPRRRQLANSLPCARASGGVLRGFF